MCGNLQSPDVLLSGARLHARPLELKCTPSVPLLSGRTRRNRSSQFEDEWRFGLLFGIELRSPGEVNVLAVDVQ